MGYRNHNAFEVVKEVFKDGQGLGIEIVRRLVKDQDVGLLHKHTKEVQSAFLSTGELANQAILLIRREEETIQHIRCRDKAFRSADIFCGITDIVNHTDIGIHILDAVALVFIKLLGIVTDLNGLADLDISGCRNLTSGQKLHQSCLAAAVGSEEADTIISLEDIAEVTKDDLPIIGLADVLHLDGRLAHSGREGADGFHLHLLINYRCFLVTKSLISLDVSLLLGGAGTGSTLHPGYLLTEDVLSGAFRGFLVLHSLGFQFQIALIITVIGIDLAMRYFHNSITDII